jgi:hypothetical protein
LRPKYCSQFANIQVSTRRGLHCSSKNANNSSSLGQSKESG